MSSIKKGQKLLNALVFQKNVHKTSRSRDQSPFAKIVPKYYPVPKRINVESLDSQGRHSPVKYSDTQEIIKNKVQANFSPAMQEYLCSKQFSEKLEHKKLKNIDAFFAVTPT